MARRTTTDRNGTKAAGGAKGKRIPLRVSCRISETGDLDTNLRQRLVGQDHVIETLVCSYSRLLSGLRDPARPLLTALFLGPTGVGKTETARVLAHTLFGSERAMVRINCEEYAHGHEISKLLGAPPGYVGHDIEPLLSQASIDRPHRRLRDLPPDAPRRRDAMVERTFPPEEGKFQSIILFDEIEKAHPQVWNALLGILDDGMLTLGNNTTTDFTQSFILITSNVGSREMGELLEHHAIGFHQEETDLPEETSEVQGAALDAARRVFPLEFLNRFDEILVYAALTPQNLEGIFEKFLADIHTRTITQARFPLLIHIGSEAKAWIIARGTDSRLGARPLRRAMERELVDPLSRLIAAGSLKPGDVVAVEQAGDALEFFRARRRAIV